MGDIHFSNFKLEDNTEYFFYIGELKNYGLNIYLRDALNRYFNRRFDFIAIVPDVFEQYNYENLIVINPMIKDWACHYGPNVCCRVSAPKFMECVSDTREIKALIRRLLNRQNRIYIYMYESLPEMTLNTIPGVSILGPDPKIASRVNSKIYQYTSLQNLLPVVDFRLCEGLDALIRTTEALRPEWTDGIFVTQEYSAAGVNSIVSHATGDITAKFHEADETYLISRYIPHPHDPTVLAAAASEDDIYIAGAADQRIVNGTRFTGSVFPSVLAPDIIERLREHTIAAGRWLAGQGYRGIYGCDFLVDHAGDIRFLEINARKQGTTLEFCCTLEQSLPPGSPMLPELEFYAVEEGVFPVNTRELRSNPKNLHWGTYNYKMFDTVQTDNYIPHSIGEREAFKRVADGNLKKDFLILEHTGSDFVVAEGAFIGRIVALGHDHHSVRQGLKQGRKTIELTIAQKPAQSEELYA